MSNQGKKQKLTIKHSDLPPIPDKLYFTIGEASILCDTKAHVIRYWETEFRELTPTRRRNRRYYQFYEIKLIRQIRYLLYEEGYTIDGARQWLLASRKEKTQHKQRQATLENPQIIEALKSVLDDLKS